MSDTEESVEVAQGLLVNIFIRLPAHTQLEPMAERLRSMLDMEEPKVQSIISRLKSMPIIQIGARVRKSAADRAAADFRRVGFLVDLRPVLSLEAKSDTQVDGNAYECPSCEAKVVLTEQGQCPECDVFVHKLSNDFLLRKKIATEERIRAQARWRWKSTLRSATWLSRAPSSAAPKNYRRAQSRCGTRCARTPP